MAGSHWPRTWGFLDRQLLRKLFPVAANLSDAERPIQPAGNEPQARLPWGKIIGGALLIGALLVIAELSPLRTYLERWREVSEDLRGLGASAPLVVVVAVAVLVGVGFPRWPFCIIAGAALGFWTGLLWAQLGTLLGNYAVFLLVRLGSGDWAERYLSRRVRLRNVIRQEGIPGVILARQMPLPGLLINIACGLVPLRQRDYLVGTMLGQLPLAIPCTLIGAGILQASFRRSLAVIGLAVASSVLAWLGLRILLRAQCPATDPALKNLREPGPTGNPPSPPTAVR
jgi:uncharacterized membrane protein YdjX (TVP38/TMEM64 family)